MPTPTLGAITVYGTYPPEPPSWGGGLGSGLWDGIGWSHFSTPRIVPAWYIAQILNQKEAYYFSHYSQESRYYHDPVSYTHLYGTPRLVVLDEPNASLDDAGEQALLDALGRLREIGATVVLVTHRPKVLAATTHLLLLRDGRAQRFGATSEVLRPPPAGATGAEGTAAPRPATFDATEASGQPAQAPGMAGATGAGGAVPASSVRTPAFVAQVYPLAGGAFPGQFSGGKA